MTVYEPHDYQVEAIRFGVERFLVDREHGVGFFLEPGLGKTSITLALRQILERFSQGGGILLVAPLRVVYSVWPKETEKWDQFSEVTLSIVHGNETKRINALNTAADIHLINPDGVRWLTTYLMERELWDLDDRNRVVRVLKRMKLPTIAEELDGGGPYVRIFQKPPKGEDAAEYLTEARYGTFIRHCGLRLAREWNWLVIDESSQFKTHDANRAQAMHAWTHQFKRRSILTGTPAPNGLIDLWSQVYFLDQGKALGKSLTAYRDRYFYKDGDQRYGRWVPYKESEPAIHKAISHLVLHLSAEDHLDLPPLIENDIFVDLSADVMAKYRNLERELFLELDGMESEIIIGSAGAMYSACKGVANGGIYEHIEGEARKSHRVHDDKTEALMELIGELQGKPLLVAYQYHHDLERIRKRLKKAPAINGQTSAGASEKLIDEWNAGTIPVLLVQPQALSHGVNMQASGNDIAWYGLTDNLETYIQFNARVYRQGVTGQVRIHRILARGTVDEAVLARIKSKDADQRALLKALQKYRMML